MMFVDSKEIDHLHKILVIGDTKAGKTALIRGLTEESYEGQYKETMVVNFSLKYVSYKSEKICFQFWDTGGKEIDKAKLYSNETHIFVYVVDSSEDSETIQNKLRDWKNLYEPIYSTWRNQRPETLLVFTKSDAIHLQTREDMAQIAKTNGFTDYVVCSVLTNFNINSSIKGTGPSMIGKLIDLAEAYTKRASNSLETDTTPEATAESDEEATPPSKADATSKAKLTSNEAPPVDYEGMRSRCCNLF